MKKEIHNEASKFIATNQVGPHPKLMTTVRKHLTSTWRKPKATMQINCLKSLEKHLQRSYKGLVIDSFCGIGESTKSLAEIYPEHLIVGIDKSASRLKKHKRTNAENYLLLHSYCEAIWEELTARKIRADFHYILYPNPWPKAKHLMRRVHGHPTFATLTRLGGEIELRSNWACYVEEFHLAMLIAGASGNIAALHNITPLTPFERKFDKSGHTLWQYKGKLSAD